MNRIDSTFAEVRMSGRKALMPFICAGHPTPGATGPMLRAIDGAGASIIEIGFPFTDPIADGPVIAAAMHGALEAGVTPARVLESVASVRSTVRAGVVAMVSVSIVHRVGTARFARDLAQSGFDGVILPDVPVEEAPPLMDPFRSQGLTTTLLVAPTTPDDRVARIVAACSGFVYLLARVGITGGASGGPAPTDPASITLAQRVAHLRSLTDLPIACGFGIATARDVAAVVHTGGADAAIVGSALVAEIDRAAAAGIDPFRGAADFCTQLAAGLTGGRAAVPG
jgi:tryptophan synthase alpha chain